MWDWIVKYWLQWLFGLAVAAMTTAMKIMSKRLKKTQQENEALRMGLRELLKDRLIQTHDYYMEKGILPVYARQNIDGLYNAYHGLGGNGAITSMVDEMRRLPTGTNNSIGGC